MKYLKLLAIALIITTANAVYAQPKTTTADLLKDYLTIKNALAGDNSKAANDAAAKFTADLKTVPVTGMDDKQKAAWQKYSEKLRYDGEHISESKVIDHQREHFGSLSANMIAVLKVFRSNDAVVYQQYCPMEKKSWLSESAAIKNPFYGKKMQTCGRITATYKAAGK